MKTPRDNYQTYPHLASLVGFTLLSKVSPLSFWVSYVIDIYLVDISNLTCPKLIPYPLQKRWLLLPLSSRFIQSVIASHTHGYMWSKLPSVLASCLKISTCFFPLIVLQSILNTGSKMILLKWKLDVTLPIRTLPMASHATQYKSQKSSMMAFKTLHNLAMPLTPNLMVSSFPPLFNLHQPCLLAFSWAS